MYVSNSASAWRAAHTSKTQQSATSRAQHEYGTETVLPNTDIKHSGSSKAMKAEPAMHEPQYI